MPPYPLMYAIVMSFLLGCIAGTAAAWLTSLRRTGRPPKQPLTLVKSDAQAIDPDLPVRLRRVA